MKQEAGNEQLRAAVSGCKCNMRKGQLDSALGLPWGWKCGSEGAEDD